MEKPAGEGRRQRRISATDRHDQGDVSCLEEEGEGVDGMARKESRDRWERRKNDGRERKGGKYGEEEREREERKRREARERNPEAGEKKRQDE